jgi:hypothetical protein
MGVVYICHHIDTEGPLWENINDLFDRLNLIFKIDIPPTYENLEKLKSNSIDLPNNLKKELALVLDPHTLDFKRNWSMIEDMLRKILSSDYRNKVQDSNGNGWIYNWHIMDHVGFSNDNPRHRDIGYGNIFDFYEYILKETNSQQDRIHWHFHPISFYKSAHIPATSYDNSMETLHQILTRRIINKNWFPVVNRAGFHSERVDTNLFLEQWIPFDPSNQSIEAELQPKFQNDLTFGRFGDWSGAPNDWSLYNPDFYDWRKIGNAKRTIGRVLNMKSRHRNINVQEIEKAFRKAEEGENVYLGITNHDWREMSTEIDEFLLMLEQVRTKYPNVQYEFSETLHAFRKVIGYSKEEIESNKIKMTASLVENRLELNVLNGELFGPQPYLAIKTKSGDYFHDNFDFGDNNKLIYYYTFDDYTIPINSLDKVSIASNDIYGNTEILHLNF